MESSLGTKPLITTKRVLLWVNCLLLGLSLSASPLVLRLYFVYGGKRVWLQAFLQTAGFPIMAIPMAFFYLRRQKSSSNSSSSFSAPPQRRLFLLTPRLAAAAAGIGLIVGLSDYWYAKGMSLIPVSTSSLILSTQLAFTAVFCFMLVKQKLTPFSVNAVVLLTVAAVVLGTNTSGDRPEGISKAGYFMGFFTTVAASALLGLFLPLVEVAYSKSEVVVDYPLVMEFQFVLSLSATVLCAVGMLVAKDFQAIHKEAREFELGETKFYFVLVMIAIVTEVVYLTTVTVIHYGSSLLSGIIIAVSFSTSEVLAVIFYKEKFSAQKGISLALTMWGLCSYFYGEWNHLKKTGGNPTLHGSNGTTHQTVNQKVPTEAVP